MKIITMQLVMVMYNMCVCSFCICLFFSVCLEVLPFWDNLGRVRVLFLFLFVLGILAVAGRFLNNRL